MIKNYRDFLAVLFEAGFSSAVGGKDDSVFGLFRYEWGTEVGRDDLGAPILHTGNPETDPWECVCACWKIATI